MLIVYPLDYARTRMAADVSNKSESEPSEQGFTSIYNCIVCPCARKSRHVGDPFGGWGALRAHPKQGVVRKRGSDGPGSRF